jgi:hypothetical protein
MKPIYSLLILLLVLSCKSEKEPEVLTADAVINKSMDVSGGSKVINSKISFDFRGIKYLANRNKGQFVLGRIMVEENNDSIFDLLSNDGFERFINDELITLPDSMVAKYISSVNSVHYFSVLPYGLNDKAVNKTLLGKEIIKGKQYNKIKITFSQEGGGEDFDDEFIYWINTLSHKIDYVAYSYAEDDGIGIRFREAYNERTVNGIRFVDYNNYKPEATIENLINLGILFQDEKLKLLSKIELEAINVDLINN